MKFETTLGSDSKEIDLNSDEGEFTIDDDTRSYTFHRQENGRYLLRSGTKVFKIDNVSYDKYTIQFTIGGAWCTVDVRDEQDLLLDKLGFKTAAEIGEGELNAPMPGKILEMIVKEGDKVSLGDPVAILEAMKMENELKAPIDGIVKTIAVSKNDSVEKNALILEIEASG